MCYTCIQGGDIMAKAQDTYNSKVYDRLYIRVFKGESDLIKEYAKNKGMSVNSFIRSLLVKEMGDILPKPQKEDKE